MTTPKQKVFFGTQQADAWLQDKSTQVTVLGRTTTPYKVKTRNGYKISNQHQITIYYKEN
jgi:hypothetical protein